MEFTHRQLLAIRKLERAFKTCKDVELCFVGECDHLIAANYTEDLKEEINNSSSVEVIANDPDSIAVDTHETMLDSGAI